TGRLRCANTLTHSVVANVQPSAFENTATSPRACAAVAPSSAAIPENPINPTSATVLAVPAVPDKLCSAIRSNRERDAGSHGTGLPHGGAPFGSPARCGMAPRAPVVTTDAPYPPATRYRDSSVGARA